MEKFNIEILRLLYSKRKHILIITAIAGILGVICSLPVFMKPKFKSTTVVYPTNIAPYSEESPTEQLMQFLASDEVRKDLLKNFDLAKHYDLDTASDKFETYFNLMFEENVKFSQTRFESIQIEVTDTDPKMAQKLAYGIINAVNKKIRISLDEKTNEIMQMHVSFNNDKRKVIDSIEDKLRDMSKISANVDFFATMIPNHPTIMSSGNVGNYLNEVEKTTQKSFNVLPDGKSAKLDEIMSFLGKKGIVYTDLSESLTKERNAYLEAKQYIDICIRNLNKDFTYYTMVSKPNLPDSKISPKRSVIVIMACVAALLFSCIYFIFIERLKKLKAEIVQK